MLGALALLRLALLCEPVFRVGFTAAWMAGSGISPTNLSSHLESNEDSRA